MELFKGDIVLLKTMHEMEVMAVTEDGRWVKVRCGFILCFSFGTQWVSVDEIYSVVKTPSVQARYA